MIERISEESVDRKGNLVQKVASWVTRVITSPLADVDSSNHNSVGARGIARRGAVIALAGTAVLAGSALYLSEFALPSGTQTMIGTGLVLGAFSAYAAAVGTGFLVHGANQMERFQAQVNAGNAAAYNTTSAFPQHA